MSGLLRRNVPTITRGEDFNEIVFKAHSYKISEWGKISYRHVITAEDFYDGSARKVFLDGSTHCLDCVTAYAAQTITRQLNDSERSYQRVRHHG